ncbi:MAG: VOC family protein [Treponema sp.]|nr:VOC family protein [Treponema sp.]
MTKADFLGRSIGQIGYVVENVEETVKSYYERFGIGGWHFYTYKKPFLRFQNYHGKPASYSSRIALGYLGETRVEFIQSLEGPSIYTDFISSHGYGVQHLGIYVASMKEALAKASAAGFSVVMDGGGFGLDGDGHFAYLDTENYFGVTYELIERPKRRQEPDTVYPAADSP